MPHPPTELALPEFARQCFPHYFSLPFSPLHHGLFARRLEKTAQPVALRRGQIDLVLAPRGAAKSTLVSFLFPLHALLSASEPYTLLISATLRQAVQRLANLRTALHQPEAWREQFPAAEHLKLRTSVEALQLGDCRIEAFSAGSELRGLSHGAQRPTWIILDDIERGDRIRSERYREQLHTWFIEVVENLGSGATNIDLVGTLLHPDALPARLRARPDVRCAAYRSILREAAREDLWDAWRGLLNDLGDEQRLHTARAFFEVHAADMLAGAEVLWPERESYYDLQLLRTVRGVAAFNKEKQNLPGHGGEGLFQPALLRRFRLLADESGAWVVELRPGPAGARHTGPEPLRPLSELRVFGYLDPALGGGGGDYAAIVTLGIDSRGYLHVLDVWLERTGPARQIARMFELHARWQYEVFGLEDIAFQKLLLEHVRDERERRREQGLPWQFAVRGHKPVGRKEDRIAALEPLVANGWLLFAESLPAAFMEQLGDFPHACHDDGPDALAGAVELARSRMLAVGRRNLAPDRRTKVY